MPNDVCLRGNTFILLLLRAANDDLSASGGWGVKGNGITKPALFLDLLKIIKPAHSPKMSTLAQYFSAYMDGSRPNSDTAYPFFSPAFRDMFKTRMKENYSDVLLQMDQFCKKYLCYDDAIVRRQLVAGLLIALHNDRSIGSNAVFDSGYAQIQKSEFKDTLNFKLQPFLLSVWYYLVTRKYDASEAKGTYTEWTGHAEPNTAPPIITKIGLQYADKIQVEFDDSINPESEFSIEDSDEYEVLQDEESVVTNSRSKSDSTGLNQNIINPVIMNFNGTVQNVNPNATTVNNTYYYNTEEHHDK